MIDIIEFNDRAYPLHTAQGFAAQYAFPFAEKICKGVGYDVGCNREEWKLPSSIAADPAIAGCTLSAQNLPMSADFIFSSHCLEHIPDWVGTIDYWHTRLNAGGVVFLYLPHPEQEYWLPFNNRKHIHSLTPTILEKYFKANNKWMNVFVTHGYDLNYSFYAIAEKI